MTEQRAQGNKKQALGIGKLEYRLGHKALSTEHSAPEPGFKNGATKA